VQALTPLTIGRNRFAASFLGSLWGLGHSAGQLVLGLVFTLLKEQFTNFLPFLERWAGVIVGLTLVAIGVTGIMESRTAHATHLAEGAEASMSSMSDDEAALFEVTQRTKGKGETRVAAATFATGVLYGLQPDALFVVIPALALPTRAAAFAYCVMFVIGTVIAMGGYTLFIGTASEKLCRDRPWLQRNLSTAASMVAIVVGAGILTAGFGVSLPLLTHA
jgi:sulfite exporter TauE/SafE